MRRRASGFPFLSLFSGAAPENSDILGQVFSRQLVALGVMPVAPHLYLPQLLDEATEREQALRFCLELVDTCDEVRVFGGRVTAGMKREVEYAKRRGIPVRFETEVLA